MDGEWHIGRKAIIAFLRPYLDLPDKPENAWQKVCRWRDRYGLPIEYQPNGKPYLDQAVFFEYWRIFLKKQQAQYPMTPL